MEKAKVIRVSGLDYHTYDIDNTDEGKKVEDSQGWENGKSSDVFDILGSFYS